MGKYLIEAMEKFFKDNNVDVKIKGDDDDTLTFEYISADISFRTLYDFENEFNVMLGSHDGIDYEKNQLINPEFNYNH